GIYQNMRSICEDCLTPFVEASRALHETIAYLRCYVGLAVMSGADVIAQHLEALAIKFGYPAFDDLPNRMRVKKSRDESNFDFFSSQSLARRAGGRVSRPDHVIHNGAIQFLKFVIIHALAGQIEGRPEI